jgi:hypothetical protein
MDNGQDILLFANDMNFYTGYFRGKYHAVMTRTGNFTETAAYAFRSINDYHREV